MKELLNLVNNVPPGTWEALLASGVISPLLVGVKKWFSVQSERVMITLVLLVGMFTAAGNYLLHVPTHDPSIIALQGAVIAFMTQPVYFFLVKPLFTWLNATMMAAAKFNAEVKSAAEPAGGVPLSSMPVENTKDTVPSEDFSH